jgi:hypothetical protein
MNKIFRNTLFKEGATIQKFRYALYFKDCVVIDLDLGKNRSFGKSCIYWFEFRICGVGIDIYRGITGFVFNNIYNRYWCK